MRQLAYPGLILRYITPELLDIISPIIGLPEMDTERRLQILFELESYGWLSYRLNGNEIWHRKDLRRIMIRMIIEQQPELTSQIRKAVIAYFETVNDPKSKAEIIYHKLMMINEKSDLENYKLSELKAAAEYIGSDDFDLPKPASVLLQFAKTGKITTADIVFLPDLYFKKIYEKTGRRLVNRQQFKEAFQLFVRAQELNFHLTVNGIGINDRWEQEMLFNLGEFELITHLHNYQKSATELYPILQLLHYIFPAMIVSVSDVTTEKVENLLKLATENLKNIEKIINGPDSLTIITRLSYALTIMNEHKKISEDSLKSLRKIVFLMNANYKPGHSDRSILLLNILANGTIPNRYQMSISHFKLETEWLDLLQKHSTVSMQPLLNKIADLQYQTTNHPLPARSFLNHIDNLEDVKNGWLNIDVDLDGLNKDVVYTLLRGTNSTFRNPIKQLIYSVIKLEKFDNERLRVLLSDIICTNITDLQPKVFEKMVLRKVDWLDPLIELVDREGSLVKFVNRLNLELPLEKKIRFLNNAMQDWENGITKLLKSKITKSSKY